VQFLQQPHRAERGIVPEDMLHGLGFTEEDNQLVIAAAVVQGRHAAHPHAILLRCSHLFTNALAGEPPPD
jgi:hypothetical protein